MNGRKIDPESQAIWDDLRKAERSQTCPQLSCCDMVHGLIRAGYTRIMVDNLSVTLRFCPQCGRRL
jgi:hypothetical protein